MRSILRPSVVLASVLASVALTPGCQAEPHAPPGIADTVVRREVNVALQRYTDAARAVDAEASSAFFTATGVLFEPGIAPIVGRDSIRAFIASFPGVKVDSATTKADTIEVFGETAIVWGSYFERLHFAGQPESSQHGKFVMEWKLQTGRRWLIERYYRVPLPDQR